MKRNLIFFMRQRIRRNGLPVHLAVAAKCLVLVGALCICLSGCGQSEQIHSGRNSEKPSGINSESVERDHTINTNSEAVICSADYPEYKDAKSLVEASEAVFSGKVLSIAEKDLAVSGKDAEKLPYLIYKVKMDTLYRGEVSEDVINIKQLNTGNVMPDIVEGSSYLFLVKQYIDSYPSLVNPSQSYFAMDHKQEESGQKDNKNLAVGEQKISLGDVMKILSATS